MKNNSIEIEFPKPYDYVGAKFAISGWVSLSWFESGPTSMDYRMFVEYIGLDGKTFMGGGDFVNLNDQNMHGNNVYFTINCELVLHNISFIQKSYGRITLKISGPNSNGEIYLPLIVKQFETALTSNTEIIEKHASVSMRVDKFKKDLKKYYEELKKVHNSFSHNNEDILKEDDHINDQDVLYKMFELLDHSETKHEDSDYVKERELENRLTDKYKDALEWQGPLAGASMFRINGFIFKIYSHDHDRHFHIIHKGKGIDARFSFPEIELINYKESKNILSSKEKKIIQEFLREDKNFKKMEDEFMRREGKSNQ